jgi:glycosyltransferase involved in cell wall biosynthesis
MQKFSGFGLAPYTLDNKWTYYCSPMKVVEYLACGVPVLMSSVPEISSYIKENGLGIVYSKLDLDGISHDLEFFETANFNIKAKKSYAIYNQNNLYSKINL